MKHLFYNRTLIPTLLEEEEDRDNLIEELQSRNIFWVETVPHMEYPVIITGSLSLSRDMAYDSEFIPCYVHISTAIKLLRLYEEQIKSVPRFTSGRSVEKIEPLYFQLISKVLDFADSVYKRVHGDQFDTPNDK